MKSVPQLTTPSNKPPCRVVFSFLTQEVTLDLKGSSIALSTHPPVAHMPNGLTPRENLYIFKNEYPTTKPQRKPYVLNSSSSSRRKKPISACTSRGTELADPCTRECKIRPPRWSFGAKKSLDRFSYGSIKRGITRVSVTERCNLFKAKVIFQTLSHRIIWPIHGQI